MSTGAKTEAGRARILDGIRKYWEARRLAQRPE
jgi:hypothetical protein